MYVEHPMGCVVEVKKKKVTRCDNRIRNFIPKFTDVFCQANVKPRELTN